MAAIDLGIRYAREERWRVGSALELERGVTRGELVRIGWGSYLSASEWSAATPSERLRLRALALRSTSASEPTFSHETAAAFLDIPIIGAWPDRATATVGRGGGASNAWVLRSRRDLPPGDRVLLEHGAIVTSPLRTALDLAASRSLLSGIVAISYVRRHHSVGSDELAEVLARLGPFRGATRVREAIRRSTDGSDSPLETLVVVRCQDLGFAVPEQQVVVVGNDGVTYRCDFAWLDGNAIGEADGRVKYVDGAFASDRTGPETVWREKRREDAIRAVRPTFARFDWDDAWHGRGLERTLTRAGVPRIRRARPLTW